VKGTELVWRAICDAALAGDRRWRSIADLAIAAGVPAATAAFGVRKLVEIGAVEQHARGGFSTVNPEKALTVLAVGRNLPRDTVSVTTLAMASEITDRYPHGYALGGSAAAVHYLGGQNNIASLGRQILYLGDEVIRDLSDEDGVRVDLVEPGDEVLLLRMSGRAARDWTDGYCSPAQAYADLFASPGWQAEEFRRALWTRWFDEADWAQGRELRA
jgi:hypothetical protein